MPKLLTRLCYLTLLFAIGSGAAPRLAAAQEAIDKELSRYWNAEIAVPSLQNPLYERQFGIEGEVHYGIIPNDNFYLFQTVGGRADFFLTDTIAIDADFALMLSKPSKILAFIEHVPTSTIKFTDLTVGSQRAPKLNWLSSIGLAFSPFHGKIGIFDKKITSFDINFNIGAGIINADIDESQGNEPAKAATKIGGAWGIGFRFFLTRFLNVRVDYKQYIYHPQESIAFLAPVEFSAGLAFLTK